MEKQHSPLQVLILIHYYTTPGDCEAIENKKPLCEQFVKDGLLLKSEEEGQLYEANRPALEVYINAICSVPFPKQEWIIN